MKYAVWFVRFIFAAWMIPAGINHFIPLFPQPMGSQPLSHELIVALLDSHLFVLVKIVELVAGVMVLTGFFTPLALLICMPVSFCVFFWDAPLEGWSSTAALYGGSTLLSNLLLCIAYLGSYRAMFTPRAVPLTLRHAGAAMKAFMPVGRVVLGAWMLINGISHFFFPLWSLPAGHEPLAIQLMDALVHSRLFDVAMTIQLIAGALLLLGLFVPLALCLLMPISTCALYWSLILDHQPLGTLLALLAFALNGLLMLIYLDSYRGSLRQSAPSLGEKPNESMRFDIQFARPGGRSPRREFIPALLTLLAAVLFYFILLNNPIGRWCLLMLLFPAFVIHARRLHDQGRTAWLLLVPMALLLGMFAIWLRLIHPDGLVGSMLSPAALIVAAGFALWGCLGGSKSSIRMIRS
jgi:uncharacterized membrane protein YhaH (DUF805 family)/uncharacterized membrane protein YphA (DoxX/SURF4 family)